MACAKRRALWFLIAVSATTGLMAPGCADGIGDASLDPLPAEAGGGDDGEGSDDNDGRGDDDASPPQTPPPPSSTSNHNWGGVDPLVYRTREYRGPDRPLHEDPNTGPTIVLNPSMSTRELEQTIADAPKGAQISLVAGRYRLTEQLNIERGDITIRGAGVDETIFDVSNPIFEQRNAIRVSPRGIDTFGSWAAPNGEYKAVTDTTGPVQGSASQVTLLDASTVDPGDFLFFYTERSGPNKNHHSDYFYNGMAEVASVNGNTVMLKHRVGIEYKPSGGQVRKADVYVIDGEAHMISNLVLADFTVEYAPPREPTDPHRFYNHADQYIGNELAGDGVRAIYFGNAHESAIQSVLVRDAGAIGVSVVNSMEVRVDDFVFDGAKNIGGGGVGYGVELLNSYYGDFENLRTTQAPSRHVVVYNMAGTSAFNNVHVSYTISNIDFHGGPDHSNIYYVEEANLYAKDDYASPIMDYRDPQNEVQNTVVFDIAYAAPDGYIDYQARSYGPAFGFSGEQNHRYAVDNNATAATNIVYASVNGAEIRVYNKNDTVHGGAGDDVIRLGGGDDRVFIRSQGGRDRITDFEPGEDTLGVQRNANGLSINSPADILKRASQINGAVKLDLGNGTEVVLDGLTVNELQSRDVFVF